MSKAKSNKWLKIMSGAYCLHIDIGYEPLVGLAYRAKPDQHGGNWTWDLWSVKSKDDMLRINQAFFNEGTLWEAKEEVRQAAKSYMELRDAQKAEMMVDKAKAILSECIGKDQRVERTDEENRAMIAKIRERYKPVPRLGGKS
jgi:hypothetical protein